MFNNKNTAFVVTDPQVEFLKPKGAGYGLTKDILRKYHTTENLTELFKHAKAKGYKIFISPHYFYDHDQNWKFGGQGEQMMLNNKMFHREHQYHLTWMKILSSQAPTKSSVPNQMTWHFNSVKTALILLSWLE